jgi:diguanylate cyclase (GGDEF)-like protein
MSKAMATGSGLKVKASAGVSPPNHPHEDERIARLLGFDILDTEPDIIFDRLTQMAATLTGAPIALISLVDRNRQWVKSRYGIDLKESERKDAFCAYTILDADRALIVPDSLKDHRFEHNPFVTGEPHIRFYAGIPMHNGDGLPIGSFCVIDRKPRELTPDQMTSLENLARIAMDYLEVHRSNRDLTRLLHREKDVYNRLLAMSAQMATEPQTFDSALEGIMDHLDPNLGWLACRITNLLKHGESIRRSNPLLPEDPELNELWRCIETRSGRVRDEISKTEFISVGTSRPEYAHLVVPIRARGKKAALIEMIYPDYRRMDTRIREVFDLMSVNLGIVAERELINLDLQYKANHDALTGALNRSLFLDELDKAIAETDGNHPDSVLLFIDLDGFKEVNDNFGHQTGDRLLVEVTGRLRGICREHDTLGRLSGDEFVMLMRCIRPSEDLEPMLRRIQRHLSQPFMLGDLEIRVGSSIGAAILASDDIKTPELLRRAEESMYLVKRGERKGYCIADAEIIGRFSERMELDHRIYEAVFEKRLLLHFQPIVDLRDGKITSAEALIRVLNRDGTIIEASEFISSLERIRLMPDVDEWVLAEAIRILGQHIGSLSSIPEFRISINVSPAILSTHGFSAIALNRMKTAGIPTSMLRLEIIENHLDTSNASLLGNINDFRDAGVQIAIDDFGTGYSNLQHLTSIPFDILKIDRLFLRGIAAGDPKSTELLGAIVNLGKNLGYSLIAEGIEQREQADYLLSLGCHHGQGYLFGKPMGIDQLIPLLISDSTDGSTGINPRR